MVKTFALVFKRGMVVLVAVCLAVGWPNPGGPAPTSLPDTPAPMPMSQPDEDEIIDQCAPDVNIYKHEHNIERVITFGIVHNDGRHENPIAVIQYGEDGKFVEATVHGKKFSSVESVLQAYPTACSLLNK